MSQVLGLIPDDGYTEAGVLNEVRGIHPRVSIRWRPLTIEELCDYFRAAEKLKDIQLRRFIAGYLSSHLKEWDLKDGKGEPVPIDSAHLLRLKEPLFQRLWRIITTDAAPDEEPDKPGAEKDDDLQDVLKAAEEGRTVAEVRQERQRKN